MQDYIKKPMANQYQYYRALPIDAEQIKEYSKVRLPMPVLALGGEYSFGNATLYSM
jgi:hypothetical protein